MSFKSPPQQKYTAWTHLYELNDSTLLSFINKTATASSSQAFAVKFMGEYTGYIKINKELTWVQDTGPTQLLAIKPSSCNNSLMARFFESISIKCTRCISLATNEGSSRMCVIILFEMRKQ
jgi:hypothetical protein